MAPRATDKFVRETPQAVLPGYRVIQTTEVARVGGAHTHPTGQHSVELVREGDVVKAIDITCSCGEKMRIWCSYEDQPRVA
jgi:hypothetical protein